MPSYDGHYEDKQFEPIPDGIYPFEVVDANEHTTKEQIILDLLINVGRANPFKRKVWLTFSEKAIWVVAEFLDAVGLQDHYTKTDGRIMATLQDAECIGLSGLLELKEGIGQDGKIYSNIERFVKAEGYSESPQTNAEAEASHEAAINTGIGPGDDVPF